MNAFQNKLIKTDDGSFTLYNEEFQDHYHSKSGAFEEALKKFVLPCSEFFTKPRLCIFDICFGLGYNSIVALKTIWDANPNCHITLIGFENDSRILSQKCFIPKEFAKTSVILNSQSDLLVSNIIVADVHDSITSISDYADIVFFDPFSPSKCPWMWNEDLIKNIYNKMKPDSILTTYSCAGWVRRNFSSAGFKVLNGPKIGRRGPSTICYKNAL